MLHHIVLFALEGFASTDEKQAHLLKIKEALEALPKAIPALHSMSVVLNINPSEPFDLALTAIVDSLATLPDYASHPEHVRVVADLIKPYLYQRACIDYLGA